MTESRWRDGTKIILFETTCGFLVSPRLTSLIWFVFTNPIAPLDSTSSLAALRKSGPKMPPKPLHRPKRLPRVYSNGRYATARIHNFVVLTCSRAQYSISSIPLLMPYDRETERVAKCTRDDVSVANVDWEKELWSFGASEKWRYVGNECVVHILWTPSTHPHAIFNCINYCYTNCVYVLSLSFRLCGFALRSLGCWKLTYFHEWMKTYWKQYVAHFSNTGNTIPRLHSHRTKIE